MSWALQGKAVQTKEDYEDGVLSQNKRSWLGGFSSVFFFSLLLFLLPEINLPTEQKVPAFQRPSEEVNVLILCCHGLTSGP